MRWVQELVNREGSVRSVEKKEECMAFDISSPGPTEYKLLTMYVICWRGELVKEDKM